MTARTMKIIIVIFLFVFAVYLFFINVYLMDDTHVSSTKIIQGEYCLSNPYRIYVDLDEYKLYLYKNEEVQKTYPVSGGSTYTPSPLGKWEIVNKDTWGEGFGGAWLGFNVPWGEYGIHGTDSPWFIGRSNASKGCIRMYNKDVFELYKLVPYGTVVTIAQENSVFRILKNGDVGSDVREVQELLRELGYYKGYADGVFGQYLEKSVRDFQKDNKIWVSGTVYKKTYDLMNEKISEQDLN